MSKEVQQNIPNTFLEDLSLGFPKDRTEDPETKPVT
jgi:hypothetical protein